MYYSGYIQTHCHKNKTIKRTDQILPEVYGTTLTIKWNTKIPPPPHTHTHKTHTHTHTLSLCLEHALQKCQG